MDKNVYRVINGYSKLSYEQRKEVRGRIDEYEKAELDKRRPLMESLQKSLSLGPISQEPCPCKTCW